VERYLELIVRAVFIENLALAFFLGMCTFLAVSNSVKTALGLGAAVIVVQMITVPLNNLIYTYLLADGALAWAGLAANLQVIADHAGAEAAYQKALALAPGDPETVAAHAEWLEWQGRYQEGIDSLEQLSPEQRMRPEPALAAARLWRRLGDPARARDLLSAAIPDHGSLRRPYCFSFGDACDELGDYAQAWSWYEAGNALTTAMFDPAAKNRLYQRVDDAAAEMPPGQGGGDLVFIVGMPRSGTSLLEQMLTGHPDVHGAGELPLFGELVHQALAADGADRVARLSRLAGDYRRGLPARRAGTRLLIDKMPLNFEYLPLIRKAFPQAYVIHCRRDPRDIGVSCYFTDFVDQALRFATRLEWLATYLVNYRQVMQRWSRSGPPVLTLDYEELVRAPEPTLRRLLDAIGLDWYPRCLAFADRDRVVATASHAQVRQPLYRRSVGRWRHYEQWIGPLAALDKSQT